MTDQDAFRAGVARGMFAGIVQGRAPTTVELPWPSAKLSPNVRTHWARKAHAVTLARSDAYVLTRAAFKRPPKWEAVKLEVVFCPPSRRRYDLDNCVASCKASFDGMADALGTDDSRFIPTYCMGEPIKGGLVRVTISEG